MEGGVSFYKDDLTLDWQGLALSVTCERYWLGTQHCHIEVRSPMADCSAGDWTAKARLPLPISETGFRSIFVSPEILDEWGGPLPYITAMLDEEAARPEWIAAQAKRRQLTLF